MAHVISRHPDVSIEGEGRAGLHGNQGPAITVWGEEAIQSARDRGSSGTKFDVFLVDPLVARRVEEVAHYKVQGCPGKL